jgi:hypothetical protein
MGQKLKKGDELKTTTAQQEIKSKVESVEKRD